MCCKSTRFIREMFSSFLRDVYTALVRGRSSLKFSKLPTSLTVSTVFNRKDANGKTRELHTDLAREAINYEVLDDYRTKYEPLKDEPVELVACPYFTTSLYDMTEEISCDYSELDSFVIFICMEGSCKMVDNEGNELTVNAGESILLPATTQDITITPESANVKLLETYV